MSASGKPAAERHRVLLGPADPAGVASNLALGLDELGHGADVVVWEASPFAYRYDAALGGVGNRLRFAASAGRRHDVLHAFGGRSWVPYLDLVAARARRRTCVVQYNGTDVRCSTIAHGLHPARARIVDGSGDRKTRAHRRVAGRIAKAALVQDLELASYLLDDYDAIYVLPFAIDLPALERAEAAAPDLPADAAPRIFHAPSKRWVKGSDAIEAAIATVSADLPLEAVTITGTRHSEVLAELALADVVVDQLNCEAPGVLAAEAMALGKPVLCEYDESRLAPFARPSPVVAIAPETVADRLAELLDDQPRQRKLGEEGRAYARRVHAPRAAARAAEAVYAHVEEGREGVFEAAPDGTISALDRGAVGAASGRVPA